MHIVIRVDGGPDIGYGHLMRGSAVAQCALEAGDAVTVATTTPDHVRKVFDGSVRTMPLSSRDDPSQVATLFTDASPDVVFTDSYAVDTEYQRRIRQRGELAVLQDDARHAVCADVFVNGNLYAEDLDYEFVGPEPELCFGARFAPLRKELADVSSNEPPWRDQVEQALVTMGGSDIAGLTPNVIRAFDGLDVHLTAVIGPGFSEGQSARARAAADAIDAEVEVVRDPGDLPELMFHADMAVCTASSTTYELLALGTPMVSCPVVANQRPIAEALKEYDLACVVDRAGQEESVLEQAVHRLARDPSLRRRRRKQGRHVVDGAGARRVYAELLCLGDSEGDA
jgi:UDP-2,4-diacetamido-2,4,6-trideoxy-beta-L-altropyranose hydrolase